ncbi:hypothetical protein M404DRAFT_1009208, partial [Pisolithus tinctorius Marx 270]
MSRTRYTAKKYRQGPLMLIPANIPLARLTAPSHPILTSHIHCTFIACGDT